MRASPLEKIKEKLPSSGTEHLEAFTLSKPFSVSPEEHASMLCTHTDKILLFTAGSMQLKNIVQLLERQNTTTGAYSPKI